MFSKFIHKAVCVESLAFDEVILGGRRTITDVLWKKLPPQMSKGEHQ
jgi:hypothetical protein